MPWAHRANGTASVSAVLRRRTLRNGVVPEMNGCMCSKPGGTFDHWTTISADIAPSQSDSREGRAAPLLFLPIHANRLCGTERNLKWTDAWLSWGQRSNMLNIVERRINTGFYLCLARFMNTVTLNMNMFQSNTGFARRNTLFMFLWLRPRKTWIPIQHVG